MKQQLTELAGAELRRSIVIEIATGDQKKKSAVPQCPTLHRDLSGRPQVVFTPQQVSTGC
jgi:uncharacterized protein YpbB